MKFLTSTFITDPLGYLLYHVEGDGRGIRGVGGGGWERSIKTHSNFCRLAVRSLFENMVYVLGDVQEQDCHSGGSTIKLALRACFQI